MTTADRLHTLPEDHHRFAIAPSVRFARDDHGLVLFDLCSGCYSSFNLVGSLVWSQIEAQASTVEIVERVRHEFADMDREIIDHDVRAILAELLRDGLIRTGRKGEPSMPQSSTPTTARDSDPDFAEGPASFFRTLIALAFLIYIDLLMRLTRFRRVYDTVRGTNTNHRRADAQAVRQTCRAMNKATRAYIKHAWCLQRSAACVCLLRRQGVPAELVLGVRTFPFAAHAWVELDGRVLNDSLDYVEGFLVLDRI